MSKMNKALRDKITQLACAFIKEMSPNDNNEEQTRKRLEALSDAEFHQLMEKFKNGEDYLQLIVPTGVDESRLDADRLHDVGKKHNISFYHHLWMPDDTNSSWERSNKKAMVVHLPVRIQQQLISKKVSIPKHNNSIDYFTGQPTGKESKGARVSYPEVNMLLAMGLIKTVEEVMHFRGGSKDGLRVIEQSISQIGKASADKLKESSGTVGSTHMLHSYLTAMMLKSTLLTK